MRVVNGLANYRKDVTDPAYQAVEDAVLRNLRVLRWHVTDNRAAFDKADFVLERDGRRLLFDVKFDSYTETTGRVPYEAFHELPDGSCVNGWGQSALDWLGVVGSPATRCRIYSVPHMRALVAASGADWAALDWKRFAVGNDAERFCNQAGVFVTHGYAIPHMQLRRAGAYVMDVPLGGAMESQSWRG